MKRNTTFTTYRKALKLDGNFGNLDARQKLAYVLRSTAFSAATGEITAKVRRQVEDWAHRIYG